ncbi:hypothetical protein X798_04733 [Onchocerca flexuosa]|uniref:Uncharacterized protein n=1 Tax=Onchocerca flexuosa TaxID=387005 RepID=A0A238BTF6_9BILA|nr:hypothetical protein X798_04733 [Onchocerca flexuosa]
MTWPYQRFLCLALRVTLLPEDVNMYLENTLFGHQAANVLYLQANYSMRHMCAALLRTLRLLLILQLILCNSLCSSKKYRRYYQKHYHVTLSVRNHNVTEAKFFRLIGVGNTADFFVAPGDVFTKTYEVDSISLLLRLGRNFLIAVILQVMEVYYYPGAVGFSDWYQVYDEMLKNNIAY